MAKNLQAKLSPNDSLTIFDINREAMERLAEDMKSTTTDKVYLFPLFFV